MVRRPDRVGDPMSRRRTPLLPTRTEWTRPPRLADVSLARDMPCDPAVLTTKRPMTGVRVRMVTPRIVALEGSVHTRHANEGPCDRAGEGAAERSDTEPAADCASVPPAAPALSVKRLVTPTTSSNAGSVGGRRRQGRGGGTMDPSGAGRSSAQDRARRDCGMPSKDRPPCSRALGRPRTGRADPPVRRHAPRMGG
jgi:hypothetical protein